MSLELEKVWPEHWNCIQKLCHIISQSLWQLWQPYILARVWCKCRNGYSMKFSVGKQRRSYIRVSALELSHESSEITRN